jgi:hypothetical protein
MACCHPSKAPIWKEEETPENQLGSFRKFVGVILYEFSTKIHDSYAICPDSNCPSLNPKPLPPRELFCSNKHKLAVRPRRCYLLGLAAGHNTPWCPHTTRGHGKRGPTAGRRYGTRRAAESLRINLNVQGRGIAAPVHAPSRAPLLLPLL